MYDTNYFCFFLIVEWSLWTSAYPQRVFPNIATSTWQELLFLSDLKYELIKFIAGSIKLKSYAGRSLFSGLLSDPAARKYAGVLDILDSFPDSQFFLIGDTGEQDLELYA